MIDYKRALIILVRNAMKRRIVKDEGEIIGWATNEDGQHYPIHAPQGGGGGSSSAGGGKSSGKSASKGANGSGETKKSAPGSMKIMKEALGWHKPENETDKKYPKDLHVEAERGWGQSGFKTYSRIKAGKDGFVYAESDKISYGKNGDQIKLYKYDKDAGELVPTGKTLSRGTLYKKKWGKQ